MKLRERGVNQNIGITAAAVRVPVRNCHSVQIVADFEKPFSTKEVEEIMKNAKGVIVKEPFPMPIHVNNKDEVFVGRIRKVEGGESTLSLFCVADNVRKGAATNAIQILKLLV